MSVLPSRRGTVSQFSLDVPHSWWLLVSNRVLRRGLSIVVVGSLRLVFFFALITQSS